MNELVNQFKSKALSVAESLTPVLRESRFKETGVLTPEEFVAAGDHLVHLCPTWSWAKAGDSNPARQREYLPMDKQYLITRQVPCHQRCAQMNYDDSKEKIINESAVGDFSTDNEWVDTHYFDKQIESAPREFIDDADQQQQINEVARNEGEQGSDEDDNSEALDLDEYLASGALEEEDDPGRFVVSRPSVAGNVRTSSNPVEEEQGAGLLRTRRYDLHITYDKFYQVPRFWLVGYDESGRPLTVDKMKEDFSQEHADRTITLESHPHVAGLSLATIHPCRHAAVMKRLIEQFQENGKELSVLDYLFVFLKFVQAIIPTVEYDYTRSIRF